MDASSKQIFYKIKDKLLEGNKAEITLNDIEELSQKEPLLRGKTKEDFITLLCTFGE